MDFNVIVTLGPAVLNYKNLKMIDSYGNCLYRINGAHIDDKLMVNMVEQVRKIIPSATLIVDLPGNKVRTNNLSNPIRVFEENMFELFHYQTNYPDFFKYLKEGDIIYANDSTLKMEIKEVNGTFVRIMPLSNGILQNNKGLLVKGIHDDIPFLLDRDFNLIKSACQLEVDYISLSFVRTVDDIKIAKQIISEHAVSDIRVIAKIETEAAVGNLNDILQEVDIINVDRGDLSTDIGIQRLALIQEQIIETALNEGKDVYLATQFLKNMEINPVPLISEAVDLFSTIRKGISGIQLSEETAVGKYPVECVKLVFDYYQNFLSLYDPKTAEQIV